MKRNILALLIVLLSVLAAWVYAQNEPPTNAGSHVLSGTMSADKLCANYVPGAGCTTNAVPGDIGTTSAAGVGTLWFGMGNNASLDFGTTAGKFTLAGPVGADLIITGGSAQIKVGALAACPACAAGTEGTICAINNDLAACAFSATVTAGGAHHVLGYCDGTQYVMTECK